MATGIKQLKLIVLGNEGVGKTALITRLVHNVFENNYSTTIGIDYFTKTFMSEGRPITFQMWDTAGQERFSCLLPAYIRDASIALIVYDITKKETFDDVSKWILKIRSERGDNVIIILIGNKSDEETRRQVPYEEATIKAEMMNISCIETSAKTGANSDELLRIIIGEILKEQPFLVVANKTRKDKILLAGKSSLSMNSKCSC